MKPRLTKRGLERSYRKYLEGEAVIQRVAEKKAERIGGSYQTAPGETCLYNSKNEDGIGRKHGYESAQGAVKEAEGKNWCEATDSGGVGGGAGVNQT